MCAHAFHAHARASLPYESACVMHPGFRHSCCHMPTFAHCTCFGFVYGTLSDSTSDFTRNPGPLLAESRSFPRRRHLQWCGHATAASRPLVHLFSLLRIIPVALTRISVSTASLSSSYEHVDTCVSMFARRWRTFRFCAKFTL